jgi:hypothetical protein
VSTHEAFTWNPIIKGGKSLFIPDRAKVNLRSESSWSGKRETNRFVSRAAEQTSLCS